MSSYFPSTSSSLHKRSSTPRRPSTTSAPTQIKGLDPAPVPRAFTHLLALGAILFLASLQFLPATHFRDSSDPFRKWVSFGPNRNPFSSLGNSDRSGNGDSSSITSNGIEDGTVNVVSWMDHLDLPLLAVLVNSTLSSSRSPDQVCFHFFIPGGRESKVSYYKMKVLFPHVNLEIYGQDELKDKLQNNKPSDQYDVLSFGAVAPFVIPSFLPLLNKFIYVSPNVIVKGRVEEFIQFNLSSYAVAAAEDCSERLNHHVSSDVLGAIQRSASKPWVAETPYDKSTCMLDLSVLLIDARKLGKDLVKAILWWKKVLNSNERGDLENPAIALALHDRYYKLSNWAEEDSASLEINNEIMFIRYDAPNNICSKIGRGVMPQLYHGDIWSQYLPPMAGQILGC